MNASIHRLGESARADADALPAPHALPECEADGERTLLGIRQARDLVLSKNRELIDKLSGAEDQIAELTFQRDDLIAAHDLAEKKTAELAAEVAGLRSQVSLLYDQQAALAEAEKVYVLARTEIEEDFLTLAKERDHAMENGRANALENEKLRAELAEACAGATLGGPSLEVFEDTVRQLAATQEAHERFVDQQKKNVAALAKQLSTAQQLLDESRREIARLAKERDALQSRALEEKASFASHLAQLEAALASRAAEPQPVTVSVLPGPAAAKTLSDQDIRDAIGDLYLKFEQLKASPETPDLLDEFESAFNSLARGTLNSGLDLIHYMTSAGADFAKRLRVTPAKIHSSASALDNAIEMLGWLGLRGRAEMLEISGALIYAVDDDVDNCECLAMAFEKVALQTKYSIKPEVALEHISAHSCDAIVLDVDLPGMDGFELHSRIRQMPGRAATPIVFLSGHLSTGERTRLLEDENAQFVAKPYNLSELTLRILTLIVRARLG